MSICDCLVTIGSRNKLGEWMESKVESDAISDLTSFTLGPGERTKLSCLEGMVGKQIQWGFSFHSLVSPPFSFIILGQRKQSLIRGEFITKVMKLKKSGLLTCRSLFQGCVHNFTFVIFILLKRIPIVKISSPYKN